MKTSMIALAFAAFAVTGLAHASGNTATDGTQPSAAQLQQWSPAPQSGAQKTRAEVRQELVQAEHDGQIAYLSKLYRGG
jgi:hypothetical protein